MINKKEYNKGKSSQYLKLVMKYRGESYDIIKNGKSEMELKK